ncbi:MAG: hypothetical protein MHPSP_001979, partial [Paramarteilia canceri]
VSCVALCNYSGDSIYASMKEGEILNIVDSNNAGHYVIDSTGKRKLLNEELVGISSK